MSSKKCPPIDISENYVIHYIAKTLKVYDMDIDYRRGVSFCIRV